VRRRPTLPHPPECSTIGAIELSFRVRNGTGRFLDAMTAVTQRDHQPHQTPYPTQVGRSVPGVVPREPHSGRKHSQTRTTCSSRSSAISTTQVHTFVCFRIWPINLVIDWGPPTAEGVRISHLEAGFPHRCFQRLSLPDVANQPCSWQNN